MPVSRILDSTSFSTLDDDGQAAVRALFEQGYLLGQKTVLGTHKIFEQRKSLSVSLDFYGSRLDKINPASFKFLSELKRTLLQQELLFAFYIFSAQFQLDEAEHRRQNLQARSDQIKKCARLIKELQKSGEPQTPESILAVATDDDSEKHAKYLGLKIVAPFLAEKILELSSGAGKTKVIKEWMGAVNDHRLYWVWGGGLLTSVIGLFPDDFANKIQAQQGIAAISPITGYMSWILYYTRFGVNLSLLLKHSIAGPWMSEEERKIPPWQRFKTQWNQRKFALLNDSIWGVANMACFFWLTGGGALGLMGNLTTTALLMMDLCLSAWQHMEESTQHNKDILRYEQDINMLKTQISASKDSEDQTLQRQLETLESAKRQCEFDWRYKNIALQNDLIYAAALLVAFCVMCSFVFPPAMCIPAVVIILEVVGGGLCFVLTVGFAAISGGLDIAKQSESKKSMNGERKALLEKFNSEPNDLEKKQLYLAMEQLSAESDYQTRMISYQRVKLLHKLFIHVLVPPLVFISLVFMPLGVGVAVLAAGFILAVVSNRILKYFEPPANKLPEFDEVKYSNFVRSQQRTPNDLGAERKSPSFFSEGADGEKKPQQPPGGDMLPSGTT